MKFQVHFLVVLSLLINSCRDESPAIQPELLIEEPLKEYLVSFLAEAKMRGIEPDTIGFTVTFVESLPFLPNACGAGLPSYDNNGAWVKIVDSPNCWRNRDFWWRKEIMFHELGHALLKRIHDNDTLPNGNKRSIMAQGIYGVFRDEEKLKYYLDELFDPSTPIPDWAK